MTGGRGRRRGGGDRLRDMGVRSMQSVRKAVIHILRLGRRIKVLHGAEVFWGDRLEGRRPETNLKREQQEQAVFRA